MKLQSLADLTSEYMRALDLATWVDEQDTATLVTLQPNLHVLSSLVDMVLRQRNKAGQEWPDETVNLADAPTSDKFQ
jgi:hypothetical protein